MVNGKIEADEIRKILLSNNTVSRQISAIGLDQHEQLFLRIKKGSKFAIQFDETTDITSVADLLGTYQIYLQ